VEIAEREAFDEVVLGGGHTSPMGKITIGPIAEFVLLNAKTSVRLVR
jgi:nucleotide-binding universal stress UspA family protein